MTKQVINIGTSVNKGNGDPLRTAFTKINENFTELYSALGLDVAPLNLGAFEFVGSTLSTTDSTPITIDQATTITSDLTVGGNLLPSVANGGDLGSLARPWKSLYVSNNTVFFGGVPLSLEAGSNTLKINNVPFVQTIDISDLTDRDDLLSGGGGGAGPVQPYLELTDTPFITQPVTLGTPVTVSTPGDGNGATFEIIIREGPVITSFTITNPGTNYVVGQRYIVPSYNINGTDINRDSIVFEVETVGAGGGLLTITNAAFTGAATNTPVDAYTNAQLQASPGDVIGPGLTLVRGYQGALFNIEAEAEYDDNSYISPIGTEWNNDGWGDLTGLATRSYTTFRSALNGAVGENIIGAELVMHDTINDKYYKFSFTNWGGSNGGGSYAYTRTLITDPNYFKKANYATVNNVDVIEDDSSLQIGITRDNNNGIYNPFTEEGWDEDVSPQGTEWNIDGWNDLTDVETRTYDNLYAAFGENNLGNKIVGTECVMYVPSIEKYYAIKFLSWTQGIGGNTQGGGFSYTRREIDLTKLDQGVKFPDGTVLKSAQGIGRVKSTATGNRRIEEVTGYNQVSVTQIVTTNLTTVASRAETGGYYIWIDSTATTIDNIISTPANYGNAYEFEFSLDNVTWYAPTGGIGNSGSEVGYGVSPSLTYLQGDTVYFRYKTGGDSVVWWDKADLPGSGSNFRGAVIDYHAYTGEGTIIGTIHIVDDDGEEYITHTEVSSGGDDSMNDNLWIVTSEGQIRYARFDGEAKTLKIHWTAKVFYGSELYD